MNNLTQNKTISLIIFTPLLCSLLFLASSRVAIASPFQRYKVNTTNTRSSATSPQNNVKLAEVNNKPANVWDGISNNFKINHYATRVQVQQQIKWIQKNKGIFDKAASQRDHFIYFVSDRVNQRNLPAELALLPMIESGYDPYAHSWVGAAGIWQFMPRTAKEMGVKQNWWYDGRRDVYKSTDAALDYLVSLNKTFNGDWLQTLAAYNAGAGTVRRAIRINRKQGKSTDFWSLNLPKQTKTYVPRLLAMTVIVENPEKYNVKLPTIKNRPYFQAINVGKQIDLSVAAKMADISLDELYALNPGFTQWATAPNGPHQLLIPNEKASLFRTNLAKVGNKQLIHVADNSQKRTIYTIKQGNTLSGIASQYHVSTKELLAWNKLENTNILRVGAKLSIYDTKPPPKQQNAKAIKIQQMARPRHYTVKQGDTLGKIAQRNHVKVVSIKRANGLRSNMIRSGQQLSIPTKAKVYANYDKNTDGVIHYKVKKGDALSKIANAHKVTVADLTKWNTLNQKKFLKPGQDLVILKTGRTTA